MKNDNAFHHIKDNFNFEFTQFFFAIFFCLPYLFNRDISKKINQINKLHVLKNEPTGYL